MNIPPWTTSRLDGFESCARQYYHTNVKRDVSQQRNEQNIWGDRVHAALELRVRDGVALPTGMEQWEPLVQNLMRLPGTLYTERKMAIDANFKAVDYYAADAWTRGKVDLTVVNGSSAAVLDYKTGKKKASNQLRLYAAYVFAEQPQVDTIKTGFIWLKDKKVEKDTIHRDQLPIIWQEFLPRYRRLVSAYERDVWPARPSGLCRGWCPCTGCEHYQPKGS
jgi:hypothetical protein